MGILKLLTNSTLSVKNAKKNKKSTYQMASFLDLLRYAKLIDWCLLFAGVISSILCGMVVSYSAVFHQGITDVLVAGQAQYVNGTMDVEVFSANITPFIWKLLFCGVIGFVLASTMMTCFFTLCERQIHKIQRKLFEAILNQDICWLDNTEVGSIMEKMSSGIQRIKQGASDKIAIVIQSMSIVVSTIVISFAMSWKMTSVMLITVPFIVLSLSGSIRAVSSSMRSQASAYSLAGAIAEEVIGGIKTVTAFNGQLFEIDRYEKFLRIGRKIGIKKGVIIALFQGVYLCIVFASAGFSFWYGSMLAFHGDISPGTVFALFTAILYASIRVGQDLSQVNAIVGAKLAAGDIFNIIDMKAELSPSDPSGLKPEIVKGRLEFKNACFYYSSRPNVKVINGVSFTAEAGQKIAFVGPSGCGKSTILSLLMKYYKLRDGSLTIDGIPIGDLNTEWLRNTIAIVPQEPVIFATTVVKNLKMGKQDATIDEVIDACKVANAHEFIVKLPEGYSTLIGESGVQLSGGQKQRLAIARALIRNPKILLLDEPTSALDTVSEYIVQEALNKASIGRTTITVAHRLSTIRSADKIIVLSNGEIMESGSHDDLMTLQDGKYRSLVIGNETTDNMKVNDGIEQVGQIPRSLTLVNTTYELDKATTSVEEGGAKPASIMDILRFSRPEFKLIFIGCVLAFIQGVSYPLFSVIMGRTFLALSAMLDQHNNFAYDQAIMCSVGFAIVGLVTGLATFGSGSLMTIVGENMTMRLRLAVFKNILRQDSSYFDSKEHSTGKLTERLATDALNVKAAIDQRLADVLQSIVSLIAGISIAVYFGWNVASVGITTSLIIGLLQTFLSSYLKRRVMQDMVSGEEVSRMATESIKYARTIQSVNGQKSLCSEFHATCKIPHRLAITRGLWQSLSYGLNISVIVFNSVAIYLFGLFLIRGGYTTPYAVFQVIRSLNTVPMMIMLAAAYFPEYLRSKVSAGLMFSMLSKEPKIDNLSDKGVATVRVLQNMRFTSPLRDTSGGIVSLLQPIRGNIDLHDVHFAYPNSRKILVLNGLNLSASFGNTIALVGMSGCGKSTVMQLIERFYDVLGGKITIDGVDVREYNIRHLRNALTFVGQEPILFNLSIRENISYGVTVAEREIEFAATVANIHTFIESLPEKYDTVIGPHGVLLSGGQKQRIAIARAIARNPQILLLDEPTSSLDSESEKLVQEALNKMSAGRTCITITHKLSTIRNADLIAVMRDGRILEAGSHQQLLQQNGFYCQLVEKKVA